MTVIPGSSGSGGSGVSPADLAAMWRTLKRTTQRMPAATMTTSSIYSLGEAGLPLLASAAATVHMLLYLDPAELSVSGLTARLKLRVWAAVNDVAPGQTLTFGLYPVGTPSGGLNTTNPNYGTVVAGSTAAVVTPAANSKSGEISSGEFDCPTAGWYGLAVVPSAALTANSQLTCPVLLETRST